MFFLLTEHNSDKSWSISIIAARLIAGWFTAIGSRQTKKVKETKKLDQFSIREMGKEQRT